MRKKTTEEFKQDVYDKFGDKVSVISEYIDKATNITIKCNICGNEFTVSPDNYLHVWKCYCKKCGKEKHASSRRFSTEDYKQVLFNKFGDTVSILEEYKGNGEKILHKCNLCNKEFYASPKDMLRRKKSCSCQAEKIDFSKRTANDFINNAIKIHGDKYDYSKINYINNSTKVEIVCPEHGSFYMSYDSHVNKGYGCPKCALEQRRVFAQKVEEAKQVWNNYYEYPIQPYKNVKTPIRIICPEHGEFFKSFTDHILNHQGCPKCLEEHAKEQWTNNFFEKAKQIHGDIYDYSLVNYVDSNTKVEIICKQCGKHFHILPGNHINQMSGCPYCSKSKGEKQIERLLEENNIKYEPQKKFDSCKNIRPLPFDFYLPDYNLCIEFQGKQHFEPVEIFGGEEGFKQQQINDNIKREWCSKEENPNLVEINSFSDIDKFFKTILME